ncbi:MAG: ATP-binding protein [Ignavibacteriae bacterium]|nr:ATP-binding protein [Ignavibacteriota bacterium]
MNDFRKNIIKKITVKSSTDNLSVIRDFIRTAAKDAGFDNDTSGKIVLAADEACTNIIKHAYKYSNKGKIGINISVKSNKFSVSITDNGEHFNSTSIPEPDLKKYYQEKKVGGLGMFLMKKLMDEVKYSQPKDKKNKVTLVKYLS